MCCTGKYSHCVFLLYLIKYKFSYKNPFSVSACVCLSVVSKVWQEQTVQRLLQLIELPLLDGVLDCGECPHSAGNNNEPDILYTSNYLDREILKAFKESQ